MKDFVHKKGNTLAPGNKMLKRMPTAVLDSDSNTATKGAAT